MCHLLRCCGIRGSNTIATLNNENNIKCVWKWTENGERKGKFNCCESYIVLVFECVVVCERNCRTGRIGAMKLAAHTTLGRSVIHRRGHKTCRGVSKISISTEFRSNQIENSIFCILGVASCFTSITYVARYAIGLFRIEEVEINKYRPSPCNAWLPQVVIDVRLACDLVSTRACNCACVCVCGIQPVWPCGASAHSLALPAVCMCARVQLFMHQRVCMK